MKRILLPALFCVAMFQCKEDESASYPAEPKISFQKIEFIAGSGMNSLDSLVLTIRYQDGDKDLGLDPDETDYPYHYANYFLADGAGGVDTVYGIPQMIPNPNGFGPDVFADYIIPNSGIGKLVTNATRNQPNYEYLPDYHVESCDYSSPSILFLVREYDNLIDNAYNIVDTLVKVGDPSRYFVVDQPVFTQRNPNSLNIHVEFWYLDHSGVFQQFDWSSHLYCADYDGRFPFIGKRSGKISVGNINITAGAYGAGTIRYAMANNAFQAIFASRYLKLKVSIKDRALHQSNILETPQFDLASIKK